MNIHKPLFSIVIANYNSGLLLKDAIQSVLSQSFVDYELILVDGGSNDKSLDIIYEFKSHFSWWVSEKDNGQSDAFNKGFDKAKGEFFFWLNADDILLPESLKIAEKIISSYPTYQWFSANTIFFNSTGSIQKCSVGPKWNSFLIRKNPIYVYGPTSIFHRDLFYKSGGFDLNLRYTMDGDLWYKFYNMGEKFFKIDDFFWGFRIHGNSKTSHAFNDAPNERFAQERKNVLSKNKHEISKMYQYLLVLYKALTGTYLKSLYLTMKNKGKSIHKIK